MGRSNFINHIGPAHAHADRAVDQCASSTHGQGVSSAPALRARGERCHKGEHEPGAAYPRFASSVHGATLSQSGANSYDASASALFAQILSLVSLKCRVASRII